MASGSPTTLDSLNGRIMVGGTAYPATQAGIQRALNEACRMTAGAAAGTALSLPPMKIVATSRGGACFTQTCPLVVAGAGKGHSSISGSGCNPLWALKPNEAFPAKQHWVIEGMQLNNGGGDGILLDDTNGFGLVGVDIENNEIHPRAGYYAINTTGTTRNASLAGRVIGNELYGGIQFHGARGAGDADGWYIANNVWPGSSSTPCIVLNGVAGEAQWMVFHNLSNGCGGGFVVSTGTSQPKILYNQYEQTMPSNEENSAMIDLQGTTYTIDGAEIRGNNLNGHNMVNLGVRLDHASNTHIDANVFSGTKMQDIAATENATLILGENEFTARSGVAAACRSTGLDTGNCRVTGRNFIHATATLLPEGSPSASGTLTVTFPAALPAPSVCIATLANGAKAWNARATVIGSARGPRTCHFNWDNNGIALTAGGSYNVEFYIGMQN